MASDQDYYKTPIPLIFILVISNTLGGEEGYCFVILHHLKIRRVPPITLTMQVPKKAAINLN